MASGITPPGMQQRYTGYDFGKSNRFQSAVENTLNRANQLEILSAQLKAQKDIADERNKTTIQAAEISQETQFGVTDKTQTGATGRTELGITSAEKITTKKETGATGRTELGITSAEKISTEKEAGATTRTGMGITSSEKISTEKEAGATTRTKLGTASAEQRNLDTIASNEKIVGQRLAWAKNERILIEGGLDGRLAKNISSKMDLSKLSHTEAMKRLTKELGTRVDITKMREDGSLSRMTKQIQSNELIAEMRETGSLDRLVKQITSNENLSGLDNEAKMERLRESLFNDNVMQTFIQNNLNKRQLTGIDAKKELTAFVEGETFKRLNLDLQSREAIQGMLEQGRNVRDKDQFLYNTELQLDRASQKMAQQIEGQEHETGMAEQKFEQAKELGNVNFERDVLKSILGIKMKGKAERQSFNFLASPFSLGKTSNFMGINYKEKDVLDQVGKNLPTLAEAVRIARNIPDDITTDDGGWFGASKEVSTMPPKKAQLLKVLVNYQNELSGSEFFNWGESSSIKKDAKMKLGDVNSLIEMLNAPSSDSYESFGTSAPY